MIVLGLNHGEINSSAALYRDGGIVGAAQEERFIRQKLTKSFPANAIKWLLADQDLTLADCDAIAQGWNPGAAWVKYNPLISAQRAGRDAYFYGLPDNLLGLMPQRQVGDWVRMDFDGAKMPPIYYVQHHRAHAAAAFFLSPFEEAAILTADFRGELECTAFAHGRGNSIEALGSQAFPNSLGMLYSAYTELLGYRPDNDEWKVMAMSAFDIDHEPLLDQIRGTYRLLEDGRLELDQAYYKGATVDLPHLFTPKLVELLGGRVGKPHEVPDEWHFRVSKAMQAAAEEIALHFLRHLHRLTGSENIVLGGGFFMNSVLNGKLQDISPFKNVYISYAPTDAGNSLGAALFVAHSVLGEPREPAYNPATIGPEFSSSDAVRALERRRIPYQVSPRPTEDLADELAAGKVVAVLHGRLEFGDRALGNRSILADPRDAAMKDRINSAIKYREAYRPFAPVVCERRVTEYFEVPQGFTCRYMEKVVPIREEWRAKLGAVTHVDGSGRVQTVDETENPRFHAILEAFGRRSGIPILLNTSFNINGEPIVLSCDDALTTFFNSGLDTLVMEDCFVRKSVQ